MVCHSHKTKNKCSGFSKQNLKKKQQRNTGEFRDDIFLEDQYINAGKIYRDTHRIIN